MAWEASGGTTISSSVSVSGTSWGNGSSLVSLNPGELCHVEVKSDPPTTPTDDLIVGVFPTLDGGTTYASEPVQEYRISKDTDPLYFHFPVYGFSGFQLQYKMSGATDTNTVTTRARKDGVNA